VFFVNRDVSLDYAIHVNPCLWLWVDHVNVCIVNCQLHSKMSLVNDVEVPNLSLDNQNHVKAVVLLLSLVLECYVFNAFLVESFPERSRDRETL